MFPASCNYHSQILLAGKWRGSSSLWRESIHSYRLSSSDNPFFSNSNGSHLQKVFRIRAMESLSNTEQLVSTESLSSLQTVYDIREPIVAEDASPVVADVSPVENLPAETLTENLPAESLTETISSPIVSVEPGTVSSPVDIFPDSTLSVPESLDAKASFDDFSSGVKDSFSSSLSQGENVVKNTLDSFSSSVTSITRNASEFVDNALSKLDQTGDITKDKVLSFSTALKEASVDLLRQSVSIAESSLASGVSFVVYSYNSAKESLPPDFKNSLNSSEEIAIKVIKPVGAVLEKVNVAIGGLERNIGLDPDDPIIHLVLFLGTAGTFWVVYRVWTYGGYAGDLSPTSTLELLKSREKAILVDVRPEDLREKDGVPDLRRTARFRYSSVTLPEVDGAVKRLLKGGNEVDDIVTAVIIKNLTAVQDSSKVIVMDADGTCSKGIARALRKLGIKRPYLLEGGYRSWVKQGLRVKEPKPETTLTILNEEAEAILEDINPSPLQLVGVGVGFFAALYALFEWEKTLQLIAVIGLGQTIYQRVSSYDDSEDFKEDVRLLFTPVKRGAEAFSWAAGKLETNGVGLPTSPSSSDVRSRVLQAAAKHESQPSDETSEDLLQDESLSSLKEEALDNVDVSEV